MAIFRYMTGTEQEKEKEKMGCNHNGGGFMPYYFGPQFYHGVPPVRARRLLPGGPAAAYAQALAQQNAMLAGMVQRPATPAGGGGVLQPEEVIPEVIDTPPFYPHPAIPVNPGWPAQGCYPQPCGPYYPPQGYAPGGCGGPNVPPGQRLANAAQALDVKVARARPQVFLSSESDGPIPGFGTESVTAQPEVDMCLTDFVVPRGIGQYFMIRSIKAGLTDVLANERGVPADLFAPDATNRPTLRLPRLNTGTRIVMLVENISGSPQRFIGSWSGIADDRSEQPGACFAQM